jgi:hypothetical protein
MPTEKKTVNVQHFELLRELTDKDKCPPQAKVIVTILKAAGKPMSRADLIAELSKPGVLTTRQTPERIFGFYRPRLIEMGMLKESQVATEVEVEVAEKPAKAEKAAAAPADGAAPTEVPKSVKGKKGEPKDAGAPATGAPAEHHKHEHAGQPA